MKEVQLLIQGYLKRALYLLVFGILLSTSSAQIGPPPVITVQPVGVSAPKGSSATFSVVAVSGTTMSYKWYRDGVGVGGATSSTLTINNVNSGLAGNYQVQVSNASGSVTSSNAALVVQEPPPTITTQPVSVSVLAGGTAVFSVVASSSLTMSYQWFRNGATLGGATSSTLTINNVNSGLAGNYQVQVSNTSGAVTSSNAALVVLVPPPTITTQPVSVSVTAGGNALFSVVASSSTTMSYQWFRNSATLSGATGSTLSINSVSSGDAGSYRVQVSNGSGSVTSSNAALVVLNPPVQDLPIARVAMTPSGFTLQLDGLTVPRCVIYASTNFVDWTPIATNLVSSGSVTYTDASATNRSFTYYQAKDQ
jgi:hypothetical protein